MTKPKQSLKKVPAFTKEFLYDTAKKTEELEKNAKEIFKRCTYIISYIFSVFNVKNHYFWFNDNDSYYEFDMVLSLYKNKYNTIFYSTGSKSLGKSPSDCMIIDCNEDEADVWQSFPKRWLFEDFEQELTNGKNKFEEKIKAQEILFKTKESKKKDLISSAKKKLTKEERKALNIK